MSHSDNGRDFIMKRNLKLLSIIIFLCSFTLGSPSKTAVLFEDNFNQDALHKGWGIASVPGIDFLLTNEPGKLVVSRNVSPNDRNENEIRRGNAPKLYLDAPDGDFIMETQLTGLKKESYISSSAGPALYVFFRSRDTLALAIHAYDGYMTFFNTQVSVNEKAGSINGPTYLRLKRTGNNYIFETKKNINDKWVGIKQAVMNDEPVEIDLMFPVFTGGLQAPKFSATFDYFKVYTPETHSQNATGARQIVSSNIPIISNLSTTTTAPGAVIIMTGRSFMPGTSRILLNGKPVDSIFTTSTQGLFQIPLNATIGKYTVAVSNGSQTSKTTSLTITSTQKQFKPLPLQVK
jgi:hypothetical protein